MFNVLTVKGMTAGMAIAALSGCAGVNGTRPHDMTVPEHEQAAQACFRASEEASEAARVGGRTAAYERVSAQHHRELAGEHAAAADARRKDVAAMCAETTPTNLRETTVASVEPILENDVPKHVRHPRGYYPERLKGARITLKLDENARRVGPGRSIACEAERAFAGIRPMDSASPFAVRGAKAVIHDEAADVVVEVRSDDREAAADILERASALVHVPR